MHPDECRSTHLLLLPPTLLRSITWRPVKVNNLHTIHNDPPPSTQSWERFAKSFQSFSFNFPPLSFSSKNSLRKIHSPLRTHTRYIILIFRLSSSSPSQFSLTVIIHHPSIRQFSFEPFPNGISLLLSTGPSSILRFRENCQSRCDTLDGCRNGAAQGAQEKLCD